MDFETEKKMHNFNASLSKEMKKYCCPIFIKKHTYDDKHSIDTPNGTMTFVKFEGNIYGCTCKHVVEITINAGTKYIPGSLAILGNNQIYQLILSISHNNNSSKNAFYPAFLVPRDNTDIAIKPLDNCDFATLKKDRGLDCIDLDNYIKPDYHNIKYVDAFGWLSDHKTKNGKIFQIKLADSCAELNTKMFNENSKEFTLFSELKEPHGYSFSGMSGGLAIYYDENHKKIIPLGFIYEGQPGTLQPNEDSFLCNPSSILYKCYNLTPEIFENWLSDSEWNFKQNREYREFEIDGCMKHQMWTGYTQHWD